MLKHTYIGTEHLLLGLLREQEGIAARVLDSLDINAENVRPQVVRLVGSGEEVTRDKANMILRRHLRCAGRDAGCHAGEHRRAPGRRPRDHLPIELL